MFEDGILLRIKRDLTNDEKVKFVLKKLEEAQKEIGFLKSELYEAQDNEREAIRLKEEMRLEKIQLARKLENTKRDYKTLKASLPKPPKRIHEHTRMMIYWRDRYFSLKARVERGGK